MPFDPFLGYGKLAGSYGSYAPFSTLSVAINFSRLLGTFLALYQHNLWDLHHFLNSSLSNFMFYCLYSVRSPKHTLLAIAPSVFSLLSFLGLAQS